MKYSDAKFEIKNRINIVDFISNYVSLKKTGSNYVGLCPFHNEKTPSFSVSENRQMYKCFGCGESGDVYSFLMKIEHLSFFEAIQKLADDVGIEIENEYNGNEADQDRKKLYNLYKDVANKYFKILFTDDGKIGLEYLKNRKLSFETIKKFGLGYSPDNIKEIYEYLKKLNYDDNIIDKSKIFFISQNKFIDKFRNRVIFPIVNTQNKVIGFGGRITSKTDEAKYINSSDSLIYNKSYNVYGLNIAKNTKFNYFLLCEGYMDVIMMHQAGFDNAVASLGTSLTNDQAKLLSRYLKKIIIAYDMDNAGINAIKRAIPILKQYDFNIKILNLKPEKDPDEFIKNHGKEELQKRIDNAMDSVLFLVSLLKESYNLDDPKEYEFYINDIVKYVNEISNDLVKDKYIKLISNQENINYQKLYSVVFKNKKNLIQNRKTDIKKNISDNKIKNPEEVNMLSLLIDNRNYIDKVKNILQKEEFKDEKNRILYEKIISKSIDDIIDEYREDDTETGKYIKNILYTEYNSGKKEDVSISINEVIKKIKINNLNDKLNELKYNNANINDIIKINKEINDLKNNEITFI